MILKISKHEITTLLLAIFMFLTFIPIFSNEFSCVVMLITIIIGILSYRCEANNALIGLSFFILMIIIYYFVGKGINFNSYGLIYYILSLLSAFFSFTMVQKLGKRHVRFLIILLVLLMLYVNISTIYISIANPMAVRRFGYGSLEGEDFLYSMRQNGFIMYNYGVGEAMAIVSPVLLSYALKNENKLISCLCYASVILCIFSQMTAALSASLLLTVVFCGLTILAFLKTVQMSKKIKVLFYFIIILIIVLPFLGDAFLNNPLLSNRFDSLKSILSNKTTTGDAGIRMELLLRSVKTWLANPIFGLAEVGNVGIESGVSMHTALFDYLGLYGLFSLLLFVSWVSIIKKQIKSLNLENRRYYKWGAVSLVLLLILKGPVTITTNYYFSIVLGGLLIAGEKYKNCSYEASIK